jgi:hypothetical protein
MSGSPSPATRAKLMAQFREFNKKRKSAKTKGEKDLASTETSPNKITVKDESGRVVKTFNTETEAQEWMAEQNRIEHHGRVYKKKTRTSRKLKKS